MVTVAKDEEVGDDWKVVKSFDFDSNVEYVEPVNDLVLEVEA